MSKEQSNQPAAFPYVTHLNILFPQLEKFDVPMLARAVTDQWYNQTLCEVNGSVVRLGIMQGEYHWHKHEHDDEFFFCLEGKFFIDLEGRTISLGPPTRRSRPEGGHAQNSGSAKMRYLNGRECWDCADGRLIKVREPK